MQSLRLVTVLALSLLGAAPVLGQVAAPATPKAKAPATRFQVEFVGSIGTTVVNTETWAGSTTNDWSTLAYGGTGRLIMPLGATTRVGFEAGYQYLFWWTYAPTGYNYTYAVTAMHVAGFVRVPVGAHFSTDLGAGVHFFNNAGTKPGLLAVLLYHVPVGPTMDLPIGVRVDAILTSPMVLPVTANVGLGFRF
jgi:hypothetical protein